jgi:hypothetical protein
MKRTVALIVCFCLLFQLIIGCSRRSPDNETTASTAVHTNQATTATASTGTQIVGPDTVVGDVAAPALQGVVIPPADGIGKPGVDFKLLETGPVDGWDDKNPAPYFNPLGSKKLYAEAYADPKTSTWGVNVLDGSTPKKFIVEGYYWLLKIQSPDLTRNWLLYQGQGNGRGRLPDHAG